MTQDDILETIRTTLYLAPGRVNVTMPIEEVVNDSMDVVELIAVLGETYQVSIEPSKMNHIKTIGDIIAYVLANQGTAEGRAGMAAF